MPKLVAPSDLLRPTPQSLSGLNESQKFSSHVVHNSETQNKNQTKNPKPMVTLKIFSCLPRFRIQTQAEFHVNHHKFLIRFPSTKVDEEPRSLTTTSTSTSHTIVTCFLSTTETVPMKVHLESTSHMSRNENRRCENLQIQSL